MVDSILRSPALRAIVRREMITTLHNRYLQVFAAILLIGTGTVVGTSETSGSAAFGILMLFLYIVPLFAVLVGVHSAHEELEERPILFSHPLPVGTYVAGKLGTLAGTLVIVLALSLIPAAFAVASAKTLATLWGLGIALVLIWGSAGLAVGACTESRSRGLMAALSVWFASLVLYDIAGLAATGMSLIQSWPELWVGVLLLNPSDAIRLAGMTALEGVAFTAPGGSDAVVRMLDWTPVWVPVLTVIWVSIALLVSRRKLEQV